MTPAAEKIYQKLLKAYGKQGWWPTAPENSAKPEYHIRAETEKQKLEIIFGAILAQNTAWKNAEKAVIEMNKKNLMDAGRILKEKGLAQTIKSAGYYNQKAKKLKNTAEFLKKYPLAELEQKNTQDARALLLTVNGIGKETADSILLYALKKPIFVVDAYTRRIFTRAGIISKNAGYEEIQTYFTDEKTFGEYHALIAEHAKKHCRKKPECANCPIEKECMKKIT